jgi:hypothetical protein
MRVIFASKENRGRVTPVPGDLIRNIRSGNYINIVIETYPFKNKIAVRSVRYGCTNNGTFKLLNGRRSRLIYFKEGFWSNWEIVEEYQSFDNSELRNKIVEELKDMDTAWRPSDTEINEDDAT